MPSTTIAVGITEIAVGCGTCGWSIRLPVSEARLLPGLTGGHLGPMEAAFRLTFDGVEAGWSGCDRLIPAG